MALLLAESFLYVKAVMKYECWSALGGRAEQNRKEGMGVRYVADRLPTLMADGNGNGKREKL